MKLLKRMHGIAGVKIIIGSGFLWAWFDAFFMGIFFPNTETPVSIPEIGAMLTFGLSVPILLFAIACRSSIAKLLASKRALLLIALIGSAGSLLYLVTDLTGSFLFLIPSGILTGIFMGVFGLAWGAVYCHEGARTATPYVAGGFAAAIIIDIPLLFMIPVASAVGFTLLPLISSLLLISIPAEYRTFKSSKSTIIKPPKKVHSRIRNYLGLSIMLVGGMMLVIIGFGYVQHVISFTDSISSQTNGVFIQVIRGIVALLMFVSIVLMGLKASIIYRAGLLAMIAGFMMMPFLFGTDLFWISGAVIIGGYTAFDLFVWVAFCQVAYTQSRDPLKTIAVMRLIVGSCYVIGAAAGMLLVGSSGELHEFASAETTVVGYLVVIATVLLLSSEDVWMLFRGAQVSPNTSHQDIETIRDGLLIASLDEFALTTREKEIAILLINGRTQPWISECLSISENTVGTHVRHIYQKAEVHNRQEFIDLVISSISPE